MNNLSLFLKHHIGKEFWCDVVGYVTLQKINEDGTMEIMSKVLDKPTKILSNGKFVESGSVIFWPDSEHTSWERWCISNTSLSYEDLPKDVTNNMCKQAKLYDKIYKLIDIAYGGHVTNLSFTNRYIEVWFILPQSNGSLTLTKSAEIQNVTPLAFKGEAYAKSFIQNPANEKLAREYYNMD